MRVRTGEQKLKPHTVVVATKLEDRPGIFRLYEEYIGTLTPIAGELLIEAMDTYPIDWIEEAFDSVIAVRWPGRVATLAASTLTGPLVSMTMRARPGAMEP